MNVLQDSVDVRPKSECEILRRLCYMAISLILMAVSAIAPTRAAAEPYATEANRAVEISLTSGQDRADPFHAISVDAVFVDPAGGKLRVPAYWAGGRGWKIRYASSLSGSHRFTTECSDTSDRGLHGVTGVVDVKPYAGTNALFRHGPLRVANDRRYLEHADGTPFFWLGDTWWMGLCHRLHWPDEFQRLAADRKAKGFNVIQIVAGLYPDMPAFDPRGANEAGFPWQPDYACIRPEYFDAADQRLRHLVDERFTPCIVGAWGYYLPWMGADKLQRHWRYLIARYGAWPVVWCVAGEANLPWYLAKGFPYDDREQVHGWTEVLRYVRQTDPFRRPVTIHPTAIQHYTARHATDDAKLLDFDMLQTPHGQRDSVPTTVKAVRDAYRAVPVMPVIDGEASYEMLSDSLPTRWTRTMFWLCMTNGAAGHTYGANGIWQCNRKDQPHGASPHGGTYGKITWEEAMQLPGSQQIAWGKRLLGQYPWHRFQPHLEWVAEVTPVEMTLEGNSWIWFPGGRPAEHAPVGKRFFRKSFTLPAEKTVTHARIRVAADDLFTVCVNGQEIGSGGGWSCGRQYDQVARWLKPGNNVLAVVAENGAANVPANPAGLICRLEIRFSDGQILQLASDDAWRCAKEPAAGWDTAAFDDSGWLPATVIARHGDAPWGRIARAPNEFLTAQATGIPGRVRIIYAPDCQPITVQQLEAQAAHAAAYFDPVTGVRTAIGEIRADASGRWTCPPPEANDHDWVLIVESGDHSGKQ